MWIKFINSLAIKKSFLCRLQEHKGKPCYKNTDYFGGSLFPASL